MNNLFYIFISCSIFCEILAQYIFKLFYIPKNNIYINFISKDYFPLIGVMFYALTGFFAFKLLKYNHLIVANIIWHIFHFLILFLIGYFLLDERLTRKQLIASGFGVVSLYLFLSENHHH